MSGIKPRLERSLKESDTHWVEELDFVLWGLQTMPNRTTGYTSFFMVYGAEGVLPCDIIHDSPCVRMYEEKRTACTMHPITDSSQTHGTRPDSGDSTPSAELSVRLLTPALLIMFSLFPFSPLSTSSQKVLNIVRMLGSLRPHYVCSPYPGASYTEAKYNYFHGFLPITYAFFFPYVPFLHHYMHRYDIRFGYAGLPGSCVYALCSR